MRKIGKVLLLIFSSLFLINTVYASDGNTTLKDLKDNLAKMEKDKQNAAEAQKKAEQEIAKMEKELEEIAAVIEKCNNDIEKSREEIEKLTKEIEEKKKEIEKLLVFEQVSNGDNIYLEYIFGASSFTDFIYRASVVEQLTKYNDELIADMNNKIDENKKLQEKLEKQIIEEEKAQKKLEDKLKKSNLSLNNLIDEHEDAEAAYDASKKEVETYVSLYKDNGCSETMSIASCMKIPYASGLTRPLNAGYMSSEFGMRFHPTKHKWLLHAGLDIGTPTNTKVYASAAGLVSRIVKVAHPEIAGSSCGGNAVYVKHIIKGKEITTVYRHLHSISVKEGDYVTMSSIVGLSGGGESYDYCTTGPHLHFEIQKDGSYKNPRDFVYFPQKGKRFYSRL